MRIVLGAVIGVLVGLALYAITAKFFGIPVPGLSPLAATLFPFAFALSTPEWLLVAIFTVILLEIFAYVLAVIGLLPGLATPPAGARVVSPLEEVMRGFFFGMTAALNFGVWSLLPMPGPIIGVLVGVVGLLPVFPPVARNLTFQGVLGWLSWLMPMSHLVTPIGFILFLVNLPFALAASGPAALRFDVRTATIETSGGITGITGASTGFNLGNFTFLILAPPALPATVQTPFGGPGISAHETGHTLSVAAFGGVHGWINAIDENIPPPGRGLVAYGELLAEGHFPTITRPFMLVWS